MNFKNQVVNIFSSHHIELKIVLNKVKNNKHFQEYIIKKKIKIKNIFSFISKIKNNIYLTGLVYTHYNNTH